MSWRRKTFDELPALSVRGPELRKDLRIITAAWIFGSIWMVSVAGSKFNYFGRMVGFTNFDFGLFAALPFLANIGQLVATILIERTGLRKFQFLQCATAHRLLWLVVAAVPLLLPIPSRLAVWTMLMVIFTSSFLAAVSEPAWWTWMGDIIPRRIRGRFMATRGRIAQVLRIPVVLGLALLLHVIVDPDLPMTASAQPKLLWTIMAVFAVAAMLGAADILLFRRIREVIPTTRDRPRPPAVNIVVARPKGRGPLRRVVYVGRYVAAAVRHLLLEPLSDRVFRHYVTFGAVIMFGMIVGGPFYWRTCLEDIRFSPLATDVLFLVIGPVIGIASLGLLGRLIDRWGRRPLLILGTALTCLSVMPFFFASRQIPTPGFLADALNGVSEFFGNLFGQGDWRWVGPGTPVVPWIILLFTLFGAIGWNAIMLAMQGIILGFSDGHGRSKYVAASAVLISLGGAGGALAGGAVAHWLRHLQNDPIICGPFQWNNWHATFLLALLARIAALGLLVRMIDPGSGKVRDMMRYMGANVYNVVAPRLFYRLRIFGWGRKRGNRR